MAGTWLYQQSQGVWVPVVLRGVYLGTDSDGTQTYAPTSLVPPFPDPFDPSVFLPSAPTINATMVTRTSATVDITPPSVVVPQSAITSYKVYRDTNGTGSTLVQTLGAGTLTWTDTGLPTATPENIFTYTAFAVNADGTSPASNPDSVQWQVVVPNPPTAPTNFQASNIGSTSMTLSWAETTDSTVTKHGIWQGSTLLRDNLSATATSYPLANLTASTTYASLSVRRYNGTTTGTPPGWSPTSNLISPKTTAGGGTGQPLFKGHQPGKIFLGWSTDQGDSNADDQLDTFTPGADSTLSGRLAVRRLYNYNATDVKYADDRGRMVLLSAKAPDFNASASGGVAGWSQVANGQWDAAIRSYFQPIVARNKLTFFVFHHEPVGDISNPTDATTYCNAFRNIIRVVDAAYPNNKIIFGPNYEENRLRNLKVNAQTLDWSLWLPQNMINNRANGGWDLITWDCYQYNATTSTTAKAGVQFSHRWWRIHDLFTGAFLPAGSSAMPWMTYTPGVDIVFGICEGSARPGTFYQGTSDMTGAKYARDYLDYVFNNSSQFAFISWFNSIGADPVYNEERLVPLATSAHPSFVSQTGDTERSIDIYREKLSSSTAVKPVL